MNMMGRTTTSFALMKVIAILIAVAAAGLGTTAAVASGWFLAELGTA